MTGDPVGAERPDDLGALRSHDLGDPVDQLLERHRSHATVVVPEPLVPVRGLAEYLPGALVLRPADRPQGLAGRREVGRDVTGSSVGGVHQDVPEAGVVRVQRDGAGHAVGVVVRVRDDHHQRPAGVHARMITEPGRAVERLPDVRATLAPASRASTIEGRQARSTTSRRRRVRPSRSASAGSTTADRLVLTQWLDDMRLVLFTREGEGGSWLGETGELLHLRRLSSGACRRELGEPAPSTRRRSATSRQRGPTSLQPGHNVVRTRHRRDLLAESPAASRNRGSCSTARTASATERAVGLVRMQPDPGAQGHHARGVAELVGSVRQADLRQPETRRPEDRPGPAVRDHRRRQRQHLGLRHIPLDQDVCRLRVELAGSPCGPTVTSSRTSRAANEETRARSRPGLLHRAQSQVDQRAASSCQPGGTTRTPRRCRRPAATADGRRCGRATRSAGPAGRCRGTGAGSTRRTAAGEPVLGPQRRDMLPGVGQDPLARRRRTRA